MSVTTSHRSRASQQNTSSQQNTASQQTASSRRTVRAGSRRTTANDGVHSSGCTPQQRITRSLLGYGVIAGPLYLIVALVQIVTRTGFDPTRHAWSMLANGGPGWIQIANFTVTGAMTVAFAVGLRRALGSGAGARWAPRLLGAYGVSLIAAGVFRADPGQGFPVGTPEGPGAMSWHGLAHLGAGTIGFSCLAVGFFVLARRYTTERNRRWALALRTAGAAIAVGFVAVSSGGGSPASLLAFTLAVVIACGGISAVAINRYRDPATH